MTNCSRFNRARPARKSWAGFTLMEVMIALAIMAIIAVLASQASNTAASSAAATREAMDRLAEIDRLFVLLEGDFRNAVAKPIAQEFGEPLPPIFVAENEDYFLTILRAGVANPLLQNRTEMARVGYRYDEDTVWRDTWYALDGIDQDQARPRKLLTGVKNLALRVLPPGEALAGNWPDSWNNPLVMPAAVEVTVELEDMGEITRLFSVLPGLPMQAQGGPFGGGGGGNQPPNQPNQQGGSGNDPQRNGGGVF